MSSRGCVSNVKRTLLKVPNIIEAEVRLNPQGAITTMDKFIALTNCKPILKM
jgi:copper chaperone CopZ